MLGSIHIEVLSNTTILLRLNIFVLSITQFYNWEAENDMNSSSSITYAKNRTSTTQCLEV
jgi:hypothetical protein